MSQLIDQVINSRHCELYIDGQCRITQNTDCKFRGMGTGPKFLYNNMDYSWKFVSKIFIVYHYNNVSSRFKSLNTGKTNHEVNI